MVAHDEDRDDEPETSDLPDYSWAVSGGWPHQYSDFLNRTTSARHSRVEQILRTPEVKAASAPQSAKQQVEPPRPLWEEVQRRAEFLMVGEDGVLRPSSKEKHHRSGDGLQTWSLTRSGKFGFFSPHNRWNGGIRFEVLHYTDGRVVRRRETGEFHNTYPEEHHYFRTNQNHIERRMLELGISKVEYETEECSGGQTVVHDEIIDMLRNRVEL